MWQLNDTLKQRGVNQPLRIQVNEDDNSVRLNQEIYATSFSNMEYYQVVDDVKYKNILQ